MDKDVARYVRLRHLQGVMTTLLRQSLMTCGLPAHSTIQLGHELAQPNARDYSLQFHMAMADRNLHLTSAA